MNYELWIMGEIKILVSCALSLVFFGHWTLDFDISCLLLTSYIKKVYA